jgi:hypothetical protein
MFSGHLSLLGAILQAAEAARAVKACAPHPHGASGGDPDGTRLIMAMGIASAVVAVLLFAYLVLTTGGIGTLLMILAGIGLFSTLVWVIYKDLD